MITIVNNNSKKAVRFVELSNGDTFMINVSEHIPVDSYWMKFSSESAIGLTTGERSTFDDNFLVFPFNAELTIID